VQLVEENESGREGELRVDTRATKEQQRPSDKKERTRYSQSIELLVGQAEQAGEGAFTLHPNTHFSLACHNPMYDKVRPTGLIPAYTCLLLATKLA
jgi:hypothetical protein